jgi:hypothetical protein
MDEEQLKDHHSESKVGSAPPLPDELIGPTDEQQDEPESKTVNKPVDDSRSDQSVADPDKDDKVTKSRPSKKPPRNFVKRWGAFLWHKKRWTLPIAIVVVVFVLAGVPWTRYRLAGLVLKQNYSVDVIDATTGKPVSSATVSLDHVTAITDNRGLAKLHVHVGNYALSISKKYYKTSTVTVLVPILHQKSSLNIRLTATGRQVPIVILNKINGQPIADALVRVADTEATTDSKGDVTIVLPANDTSLPANFSASGYNDGSGTIVITAQAIAQNQFQLTPAGSLYFLSQLSGTMDVVKTNLDGTDRQTVLAGTGNEDTNTTVLMASRDWQYLALESSRVHPNQPELYLINTTANNQVTTIDTTSANYNLIGWIGDSLIYSIDRNDTLQWQPAGEILKSYNAATGQLTVLDQTAGQGTDSADYAQTTFGSIDIVNNDVVYTTDWNGSNVSELSGLNDSLYSIQPGGTGKQDVRDFPVPANLAYPGYYISAQPYAPQSLYVQVPDNTGANYTYYSYSNGTLSSVNITDSTFYNQSPNYLVSPDGTKTFWSEVRDGKNTLFIGDANGQNEQQIASLSDYAPYAWYTDNYLIVSKDNDLYIMPVSGGTPLKVTDYFSSLQPGYNYGGE